jgi:hypothetical protein
VNRSLFIVPIAVLVLSLVLSAALPRAGKEKRIKGTVLDAKASYCEPKKQDGCTGTLTLDASEKAGEGTLTIHVPLGTPISAGCEVLSLGELEGRRVVVTEVDDAGGRIARAISAADAPQPPAC